MDSVTDTTDLAMTVKRSPTIGAMAGALAKAQAEVTGAAKDSLNPHFKNKYADLASVWDACRPALSAHGIAVVQSPAADGARVTVTTLLLHGSGEWIEGALTMTAQQNTPQGIGSCITYARRYALAAMAGVAPEDDDGNEASRQSPGRPVPVERPQQTPQEPEGFRDWLADMQAVADEGTVALESAWKKSQPYMRKFLTDTDPDKWEAIKAKAAKVKPEASRAS